jgi:hypothetical protein
MHAYQSAYDLNAHRRWFIRMFFSTYLPKALEVPKKKSEIDFMENSILSFYRGYVGNSKPLDKKFYEVTMRICDIALDQDKQNKLDKLIELELAKTEHTDCFIDPTD